MFCRYNLNLFIFQHRVPFILSENTKSANILFNILFIYYFSFMRKNLIFTFIEVEFIIRPDVIRSQRTINLKFEISFDLLELKTFNP